MNTHNSPKITRRKGACTNCKQRKIRCNGDTTCSQCQKSVLLCSYSPTSSQPDQENVSLTNSRTCSRRGRRTPGTERERRPHVKKQSVASSSSSAGSIVGQNVYIQPPLVMPSLEFDVGAFAWADIGKIPDQSLDIFDTNDYFTEPIPVGIETPVYTTLDTEAPRAHSLDHTILYGADHEWSKAWGEELCRDSSSLAPLRFLSRHISDEHTRGRVKQLEDQFTSKLQHPSNQNESVIESMDADDLSFNTQNKNAQFLDAFFADIFSYPPYVSRQLVEDTLADLVFSPKSVDANASSLVNGILAIGCRNIALAGSTFSGASIGSVPLASQYFNCALQVQNELAGGQPSLRKLQALVTLVIYSKNNQNVSLARSLLSQAIHAFQELTLILPRSPTTIEEKKQQENVESIFWLLYSIEKPFMIRFGGFSMINDDLIAYNAPSSSTQSTSFSTPEHLRWQLLNYRYACLCSSIVKSLYSHSAIKMSPLETTSSISRLSSILEAWRLSIPVASRPPDSAIIPEVGTLSYIKGSGVQLDLFLKYAEATFAIHRWAMIQSHQLINKEVREKYQDSGNRCINIAKRVLEPIHSFYGVEGDVDWPKIYLPLLSTSILFITAAKNETDSENLVPYIGLSCGYFARLTLGNSIPPEIFEGVNQLGSIVQRVLNETNEKSGSQSQSQSQYQSQANDTNSNTSNQTKDFRTSSISTPRSITDSSVAISLVDETASKPRVSPEDFLDFCEGASGVFGFENAYQFDGDFAINLDLDSNTGFLD